MHIRRYWLIRGGPRQTYNLLTDLGLGVVPSRSKYCVCVSFNSCGTDCPYLSTVSKNYFNVWFMVSVTCGRTLFQIVSKEVYLVHVFFVIIMCQFFLVVLLLLVSRHTRSWRDHRYRRTHSSRDHGYIVSHRNLNDWTCCTGNFWSNANVLELQHRFDRHQTVFLDSINPSLPLHFSSQCEHGEGFFWGGPTMTGPVTPDTGPVPVDDLWINSSCFSVWETGWIYLTYFNCRKHTGLDLRYGVSNL